MACHYDGFSHFSDLLQGLPHLCYPLGVQTIGWLVENEHLGIADHLTFYMGCEDYPRGKPAPDGFLAAASRLGVPAARSLVVEDSEAGIAAGLAAGMRVLATSSCNPAPGSPGHQDQRRAHRVVSSLAGLSADDLRALMGEGPA